MIILMVNRRVQINVFSSVKRPSWIGRTRSTKRWTKTTTNTIRYDRRV